ncbi:hypothetical protein [Amnibacterium sp.]|uniref:hypothetical protein n=1 Tax=Amnibacterium sp. TaxID=1872496 RepID=UPI002624A834|nr:hypothetical protein [Amnibacterium sp.]MCU1472877.1 hypothetical protein [Amnibacterium sp.]
MTTQTRTATPPARQEALPPATRRTYAVLIGLTALSILLQSITAGKFVNQKGGSVDAWTNLHGFIAYPVMLLALATAAFAYVRMRSSAPRLWLWTTLLFVAIVCQWLSGHAITTLGLDWVIPIHVVLAFLIWGLAIVLCVRSATLRRVADSVGV